MRFTFSKMTYEDYDESDTASTLASSCWNFGGAVRQLWWIMRQMTLTEKRFFEWHEDDISVTLRNKSGSYGGGSEVFIVQMYAEQSAMTITKDQTTNT